MLYFISLYLLKFLCIALLIYHDRAGWIVMVYLFAYMIRSQLAMWDEVNTKVPLIEVDDSDYVVKMSWIFACVISLLVTGFMQLPLLVLFAIVAYFQLKFFKKRVVAEFGGMSSPLVGLFGTISELIFYILAVALIRL